MDRFDRDRISQVYRLLADVFERERHEEASDHLSFKLGDLARRVFVGSSFEPPDELLEAAVHAFRQGQTSERQHLAQKLRRHAEMLQSWPDEPPAS